MTEGTREEALRKLDGFRYKIGFPDEWRDYAGLVIERGSYVENRMRCAAFEYARQMGRLGEPVDKGEWAMPAHVVNAYYHPLLNEIVFPAGILQPPFFYAGRRRRRELRRHRRGHRTRDHARVRRPGQPVRRGRPAARLVDRGGPRRVRRGAPRCSSSSSTTYAVVDDLHVNGRLTLGENIADLGGLTIAHDALREALAGKPAAAIDGFTPEQRFFLSWATVWRTSYTDEYLRLIVKIDPHSPARARVNGPLSNLPAFAATFEIDEASPMARDEETRAHIW